MIIPINVINWEKWNPVQGRSVTWIRLNATILEDPRLNQVAADEFKIWIYLLTQCAKQGGSEILLGVRLCTCTCKTTDKVVITALTKFADMGLIKIEEKLLSPKTSTNERTRRTYEYPHFENGASSDNAVAKEENGIGEVYANRKLIYPEEFEELYRVYPNKLGKSKGFKKYKRDIKTDQHRALLKSAIENYIKLTAGSEKQYMKHFDTFMNCWTDYLDENLGPDPFPSSPDSLGSLFQEMRS